MKKIIVFSLSLVMMFTFALSAFAIASPSNTEPDYEIKVNIVNDVDGSTSNNWFEVIPDGDNIILKVDDKYVNSFVQWIIDGEYEIVSGSLTSSVIVIRPLGDINAEAHVASDIPFETGTTNESNKSPDTSSPIAAIAVTMAIAGCAAVVAKKKIAD